MSAFSDEQIRSIKQDLRDILSNPDRGQMLVIKITAELAALDGYIAGLEKGIDTRNAQVGL